MGERRKRKPPLPSSSTLLSDPPTAVAECPSLRSISHYLQASCHWLEGRWEMELVAAPRRRRRHSMRVRRREGGGGCGRWRWGGDGRHMGRGGSGRMCWGGGDAEIWCYWEKLGDCDQTLPRGERIGGDAEEEEQHEGSRERRRRQLREVEVRRRRRVDEERRWCANALERQRWGMRHCWGKLGDFDQTLPCGEGIGSDTEEEETRHEGSGGEKEAVVAGGGVVMGGRGCGLREEERGPRISPTFSTRSERTTYMWIWTADL